MPTTPTTTPVPSLLPQDLAYNCEQVDKIVNSGDGTYNDRFGAARRTLRGALDAIEGADAPFHTLTSALFTEISSLTIAGNIRAFRTAGHTVDGIGAAWYARTSTTGTTAYRAQSVDGSWWQLAEDEPDAYMVGAQANATSGAPTDASATLNELASTGLNRHTLRFGDNYDLATSEGAFSIGAETVLVPYDRSISGEGWATKLLVAESPAVSVLFGLNTNGAGAWIKPFPGALNSKVEQFYIDGRQAAAATLVAFQFGGGYHFRDIHALGLNTVIQQVNQYSDQITVERVTVAEQPDATQWAIDLKWAGDARRVDQIHSYRKNYATLAEAVSTKFLRVRYANGVTVTNVINGDVLIEGCTSARLESLHMEDGVVTFKESSGSLSNALFWMRGDAMTLMSVVPLVAEYGEYSSLHPGVVHWSDIGFTYEESFPGGYSSTKHNFSIKSDPYPYIGHVRIERLFRMTKPQGGLASLGQKYGVSCGMADFDNYSHFASIASEWRNSRWHITGDSGDLPFNDGILDTSTSLVGVDYTFTGATGTYYYRAQLLLDKIRKIGIGGDLEVSLAAINGGVSPILVLTDVARTTACIRIYRGTASGSYDKVVDIPLIAGARFVDAGGDIGAYQWQSRTAGGMDPINAGAPAKYTLRPGSSAFTVASNAYGNVEAYVRSNGVLPTQGEWRTGDKWLRITPVSDGFQVFHGWVRMTTGTSHVEGTDWQKVFTYLRDPEATSDKFTTASEAINATNKTRGRCVYDATSGKPVWASGSAATSVWVDATGATAYTPV